jgi:hypothetical protein
MDIHKTKPFQDLRRVIRVGFGRNAKLSRSGLLGGANSSPSCFRSLSGTAHGDSIDWVIALANILAKEIDHDLGYRS